MTNETCFLLQSGIAKTLVGHKASVNATDCKGRTLLHRAIDRSDEFAAAFLIENGASVDIATPFGQIPLQQCADQANSAGMVNIAKLLLKHGADPNLQDGEGNTGKYLISHMIKKNHDIGL